MPGGRRRLKNVYMCSEAREIAASRLKDDGEGRERERRGPEKPTKMLSARRAHIIESAREFSDEGGGE